MIAMYSAASDKVLDVARSALSASTIPQLRRLSIERGDEQLVIRGRVSSFYHKQLAQELIRGKLPDAQVVNEIQVDAQLV
jgi:hypothetical protein